jgi:HK97 family phage major capsid protein
MVNLTLTPMAAYAIASRQSLRNIVFLQSWLPQSLMDQMEDSEDTDFANTLVAAATGSTSTTGFSGTANVADKLVIYIKNNIKAKYNPTAVVCDPNVWANLILLRPGTAGESYSGPVPVTVDVNGNARILGRPVYPVNWLTGNRILIGDFSKAAIVQSEGLRLRQSDSHASIFTSNEIAFLLERTEGLAIFRPDAFITTTV